MMIPNSEAGQREKEEVSKIEDVEKGSVRKEKGSEEKSLSEKLSSAPIQCSSQGGENSGN